MKDIRTVPKKTTETKRAQYICKQCSAASSPMFLIHETPPVAINCHKCGAGRHVSATDQVQHGVGMILQPEAETVKKVVEFQRGQQRQQPQKG